MSWDAAGAIGEIVGAMAVVISLVYVAYQVRQSSRQIELNSQHLQASMYAETNDSFMRWMLNLAEHEELTDIWLRALGGADLTASEKMRFGLLFQTLLTCFEGDFAQHKLGTVHRDTFGISKPNLVRMFQAPAVRAWWDREAAHALTEEFRDAVEAAVASGSSESSAAREGD